ncbi:MAG: creatininase family protein [Candidatus Helarchaeota archaeon]|nr:creatininase family protein [Candidatus Helarchaeota archaeon]
MKAENLTWPEFKELSKTMKTVIIPWGSMEAHGTHLPLSTDTIVANHIAELIAEKINALILPAIPIGYCFHAANFPGTLSFTESTLQQMAYELAESLYMHGVRSIVFITGHGDQVGFLEKISERMRDVLKIKVSVLYPFFTDEERVKKFNEIKTSESIYDIFHAEELETSLMLAISPDLVQMEDAKVEYPLISEEDLTSDFPLGDLTDYCVFGDPTVATAEKGRKFLTIMVEELLKILMHQRT